MKILICLDNLSAADVTPLVGDLIGRIMDGELTLLHVRSPREGVEEVTQKLGQIGDMLTSRVAGVMVRDGTAVSEIIAACEEGRYEMIVVGTSTVHGMLGHLLPSVSQIVAEKAPVSVVVVKNNPQALRHILICTSGMPISERVVRSGAALTARSGASATLLFVADPVPQMYKGLSTMEETAAKLLDSDTPIAQHLRWAKALLEEKGVSVTVRLRRGIVVDEILQETVDGAYDFVVLGASQHHTLWQSLYLGKISPRIVEHAPCSLMLVRSR